VITSNPDVGMIALTTIKFEISKGGGVSNDVRVQPLRLFQIEYEVSNWDFSYSLKVMSAVSYRIARFGGGLCFHG
jgi:hypothetical protein